MRIGVLELLGTVCLGLFLVLGMVVLLFLLRALSRRRERPPGTYDHPDYDSGGSIGGMRGGRAYDHPDFDSGATIGGDRDRRAHDDPETRSGASIGGGPSVGESPRSGRSSRSTSSSTASDGDWQTDDESDGYRTRKDNGGVDSPDVESGGSFGG